jgi:hypothetical protein
MDNEQLIEIGKMLDEKVRFLASALGTDMQSLETRILARVDRAETNVLDRIEAMEKRVTKQGGILQGGSKQVARLVDWSEDTDTELMRHAARISDLERQVAELKRGQS